MKDRLSKLESLTLIENGPSGDAIPDLSKLTKLRHLLLVAEKSSGAIDVKPLEKLTQLKALTIFAPEQECKNANAVGSLGELEFLTLMFKSPCDPRLFNDVFPTCGTWPLSSRPTWISRLPRRCPICRRFAS